MYVVIAVTAAVLALGYWWVSGSGAPKPRPIPITPISLSKSSPLSSSTKKKIVKKSTGPLMKVLFGSQTGTAEDFAGTLADEANNHGFSAEVVDLEEYDCEELASENFVVFMLATYGEGEPTDNAKEFYDWITDDMREEGSLTGLRYAAFGLGNKTYEHYNAMVRIVDARLQKLGARRIHEAGEGDDDSSLEDDFEQWRSKLWQPLCQEFNLLAMMSPALGGMTKKASYRLQTHDDDNDVQHSTFPVWRKGEVKAAKRDAKNPALCEIIVNRDLHTELSDRCCRHIEIKLEDGITYEPGDHLGVYPRNQSHVVEAAAKRLNQDLDQVVSLVPVDGGAAVIGPCTVREILTRYVELTVVPRRTVVQGLVQYCEDPEEKAKMADLCSASDDGNALYTKFVKDPSRTIMEILDHYPSCHPPFHHFLELVPAMLPRYYSISSSIKKNPGHVHITAVVVEFTSGTGRVHNGVATTYLRDLPVGAVVPCFVRTSIFRLPTNPKSPVVMVGPGTGLAPFRGFIQERSFHDEKGDAILFFGCRKRDTDYLYADELEEHAKAKDITQLIVAFSRESEEKVYVQHKIKEHAAAVWDILNNQGYVYVCGDARHMAKDVHKALRQLCIDVGGKTPKEAESFITQMQTKNRYQTDVWF